jgi:uncharacterized protein YprB with RNaseH-like and TPR domain
MEKLETEFGIFTNNEVTGQTAQEVYQEWLANKDKLKEPSLEERNRADIDYIAIMMGVEL